MFVEYPEIKKTDLVKRKQKKFTINRLDTITLHFDEPPPLFENFPYYIVQNFWLHNRIGHAEFNITIYSMFVLHVISILR